MFEYCVPQSLGEDLMALGIVLLVLMHQDCGMLCQDLSLIANLLVLSKKSKTLV